KIVPINEGEEVTGYELVKKEKQIPAYNNPYGRHRGRNGPLTEKEMHMARIAWKYFENNYQPTTGMVNAVNNYPSVTMWDLASYLGGLVAAYELGIIDKNERDRRLTTLLKTLNTMPFFRDELPNKAYNTITAEKVNYANQPGEIGWSALDLGRLLIWLKIIKERYPEHGNAIDNFVLRWNFCRLLDKYGTMYGAVIGPDGEVMLVQEGRLGYEEYAAKGFQLWGFNTARASKPEPYNVIPIYGVEVPFDTRDPRKYKAHNYVVCESYVLDGLELNWDLASDRSNNDMEHSDRITYEFAQRIYEAQVRRYQHTGIITARTEHQLDGPPYFVYDTIFTDGYPWNTITEDGKYVPDFAAIALKGALGLWALWETEYTDLLFDTISDLYDPEKGFYEGRYEKTGGVINTFTANNNGIMLEALLYKVQGKLLRFSGRESLWDKVIADEFHGENKCLPTHQGHDHQARNE
ncbi:MAG: DUF3131 domain-containing protein, partial [Calditrichaeota bacterium]